MSPLLSEMDGLDESGALMLLATNLPQALDPAVVRDGRMDRRVHVGRPTHHDAKEIFAKLLKSDGLAEIATEQLWKSDLVLHEGVALRDLVSGAMVAGVVDRATSLAMAREIEGGEVGVLEEDVRRAVAQTYREMMGVRHETLPPTEAQLAAAARGPDRIPVVAVVGELVRGEPEPGKPPAPGSAN
jgi:proteasome-associated ATPase